MKCKPKSKYRLPILNLLGRRQSPSHDEISTGGKSFDGRRQFKPDGPWYKPGWTGSANCPLIYDSNRDRVANATVFLRIVTPPQVKEKKLLSVVSWEFYANNSIETACSRKSGAFFDHRFLTHQRNWSKSSIEQDISAHFGGAFTLEMCHADLNHLAQFTKHLIQGFAVRLNVEILIFTLQHRTDEQCK